MCGSSGLHHRLQPIFERSVRATIKGVCKMPLQPTHGLLSESHRAKRADVWKNAKEIPTGSSPMAQKMSHCDTNFFSPDFLLLRAVRASDDNTVV